MLYCLVIIRQSYRQNIIILFKSAFPVMYLKDPTSKENKIAPYLFWFEARRHPRVLLQHTPTVIIRRGVPLEICHHPTHRLLLIPRHDVMVLPGTLTV